MPFAASLNLMLSAAATFFGAATMESTVNDRRALRKNQNFFILCTEFFLSEATKSLPRP